MMMMMMMMMMMILLIFYKKIQYASIRKNNTEKKLLFKVNSGQTNASQRYVTHTLTMFCCAALSRAGKFIATGK